jgi:hypothetical protein
VTPSTTTTTTVAPTTAPPSTTTTVAITDPHVFLLGDSVMAALNPNLTDLARKELTPLGWIVTIDAKESRFPSAGISVLKARRSEIGQVVVIQMSNNYLDNEALWSKQIDEMFDVLTGVRKVVFLDVSEFRPDRIQVNEQLRAALLRHSNMVLLDWNAVTAANPSYVASDHLHLTAKGAKAFADMIVAALGPAPSAIVASTRAAMGVN